MSKTDVKMRAKVWKCAVKDLHKKEKALLTKYSYYLRKVFSRF